MGCGSSKPAGAAAAVPADNGKAGAPPAAAAAAAPPAAVAPAKPALAAAAVAPAAAAGLGKRDVSFQSPRGERLVGILHDTGSADVVLLCHGYVANMAMCNFALAATQLAAAGVSSLRFDHPMAVFSKSERKGPFRMGNHEDEVADIAAACDYLRGLGKRPVCVVGHSKGGCNVVMFAARHPEVPKIVNLAGRFHTREGALQRFGPDILERLKAGPVPMSEPWGEWELTEEDLMCRVNLDLPAIARTIPAATRMLCLHGAADTVVPPEESEACAKVVPNCSLQLIEGADHNFMGRPASQAMAKAIVDFVLS